jgi:hypothetical protein
LGLGLGLGLGLAAQDDHQLGVRPQRGSRHEPLVAEGHRNGSEAQQRERQRQAEIELDAGSRRARARRRPGRGAQSGAGRVLAPGLPTLLVRPAGVGRLGRSGGQRRPRELGPVHGREVRQRSFCGGHQALIAARARKFEPPPSLGRHLADYCQAPTDLRQAA